MRFINVYNNSENLHKTKKDAPIVLVHLGFTYAIAATSFFAKASKFSISSSSAAISTFTLSAPRVAPVFAKAASKSSTDLQY